MSGIGLLVRFELVQVSLSTHAFQTHASHHPTHDTPDLSRVISEFDTASAVAPLDLAWCGTDAVAMRWEGLLLLAGPYGDWWVVM